MKKQRFLSALLVFCMLFSLLPGKAMAASGAEDFTDVARDSWCYDYVDYVTSHGYFRGTTNTTFSPNRNMTRAMFVVVLARFDGAKVDNSQSAFVDVAPNSWCAGAINWAASHEIVGGKGNGMFAPNEPITRAQMCAIMDRYLDYYAESERVRFNKPGRAAELADEGLIPAYAQRAVRHCQEYGLIYGYSDGTFRPQALSTRAHVAAVIYRLRHLVNDAEPIKKPSHSGGGGGGGGSHGPSYYTYTLDYNVNGGETKSQPAAQSSERTTAS
ncbi:S-layer domain-containing protein, partial [gut metagenome]